MNSILAEDNRWKLDLQDKSIKNLNTFGKHNELDTLTNGIHIVITFSPKSFSYGDAWEQLTSIIKFYYEASGLDNLLTSNLCHVSEVPNNSDLEVTFIANYSLIVFSIAPNKSGEKYHLHTYIYGIHNYKGTWDQWKKKFDRKLRSLKCISSTGSPIYYEPVTDPVDRCMRDNTSRNYYEPLIEYISKRKYPSLMNYFADKNNKNFLYHYLN